MATVPKAERQVQAQRGPVVFQQNQQINAPAGAFGTGGAGLTALSQASGQIADQVNSLALDKLAQDNTREAKQLDIEYSTAIREMMYGTPTSPGGFYGTRGQDTLDQHGSVAEQLEKTRLEILKRTTSPRVREKLDLATQARRESELNSMAVFGEKNRRVANDTTSEARMADASSNTAAKINSEDGPQALRQGLTIISNEVHDMADRNGWGPEATAQKLTEAQTLLLKESFDNILVVDPGKAKVFFENNKNLIDGRMHDTMERSLKEGVLRQQSQLATAEIMARHPNDPKAQLDAAKELDSEIQDSVRNRLQDEHATEKRQKAAAQQQVFDETWQSVVQAGGNTDQIDPAILAQMTPAQKNAIRTFQKQLAEDGSGFAQANNIEVYNEVSSMTPAELMNTELRAPHFLAGLDRSSWEKFNDRRAQMIKEANAPDGSQKTSMRTSSQVRSDFLKNNKLKGKKAAAFSQQHDALVLEWEEREGKQAPSDVVQSIGEGLLSRDPARWYERTGEQLFLHEGQERADFDVSESVVDNPKAIAGAAGVPEDEMADILDALAKVQPPVPITLGNIQKMYQRSLAKPQ